MTDALLAHASRTISVGSKSFAAAARLFPPDTRRSALMLYAWCRHCDDVIDGQTLGFDTTTTPASRASVSVGVATPDVATPDVATPDVTTSGIATPDPAPRLPDGASRLAQLVDATRRAYARETTHDPAFAAFQEVALRHDIPQAYAFDHLDGFAMDVEGHHYESIDDTMSYCYRVAGVVGLMMAVIMDVRDEAVLDRACDLGLAFQLTNIARDVVEDARIGRCYLPAQWLADAGIPREQLIHPEQLATPHHRAALARVAERLLDYAEPYYESATVGLSALPWRSAWAIATAHKVYREIGVRLKTKGAHAWDERVITTRADKLRLMAGAAGTAVHSRGRESAGPRATGLWRRPERPTST